VTLFVSLSETDVCLPCSTVETLLVLVCDTIKLCVNGEFIQRSIYATHVGQGSWYTVKERSRKYSITTVILFH